jgi:hypothetical protein
MLAKRTTHYTISKTIFFFSLNVGMKYDCVIRNKKISSLHKTKHYKVIFGIYEESWVAIHSFSFCVVFWWQYNYIIHELMIIAIVYEHI